MPTNWFEQLPTDNNLPIPYISPGFTTIMQLQSFINSIKGGPSEYPFGANRLEEKEQIAHDHPWLLPIGVELEVPRNLGISIDQTPKYESTKTAFNLPGGSLSCWWEFQLPPSYSWQTQASILSSLCQLGLVPSEDTHGPVEHLRAIKNASAYSLHCNISIPGWTKLDHLESAKPDLSLIALASGLAFSLTERLASRKTDTNLRTNGRITPIHKSVDRTQAGRVEVRTLGFGNRSSYRQLGVVQRLVTAAFAYWVVETEARADGHGLRQMHDIWSETRKILAEELEHPVKGYQPLNIPSNSSSIPSLFSLRQENLRQLLRDQPALTSRIHNILLLTDLRLRRDAGLP